MAEVAIPLAALAVAGAGTGYQIASAEEAKERAAAQQKETAEKTKNALTEEENRRKEEEFKTAQVQLRDEAKKRQRALSAGSQGRAGTILTGPLGVPQAQKTGGKTLLGV